MTAGGSKVKRHTMTDLLGVYERVMGLIGYQPKPYGAFNTEPDVLSRDTTSGWP